MENPRLTFGLEGGLFVFFLLGGVRGALVGVEGEGTGGDGMRGVTWILVGRGEREEREKKRRREIWKRGAEIREEG